MWWPAWEGKGGAKLDVTDLCFTTVTNWLEECKGIKLTEKIRSQELAMVQHCDDLKAQEAEAGGSRVLGQHGIHMEIHRHKH